jgi:hypothetical protein
MKFVSLLFNQSFVKAENVILGVMVLPSQEYPVRFCDNAVLLQRTNAASPLPVMPERGIKRVFISSPFDARRERLIAEKVVKLLDREFSHFRTMKLLYLVGTGAGPGDGSAGAGPGSGSTGAGPTGQT